MKSYEKPIIEITVFENEDVITEPSGYGLRLNKFEQMPGENVINF